MAKTVGVLAGSDLLIVQETKLLIREIDYALVGVDLILAEEEELGCH
jgi:hypothetical protein